MSKDKEIKFLDETLKEIESLTNALEEFYTHLQYVLDELTPSSRKKVKAIISKDIGLPLKKLQGEREKLAAVCMRKKMKNDR